MHFQKSLFIIHVVIWLCFIGLSILMYYTNHYMPHGQMFPTGEYVCKNEYSGTCYPEYKEDLLGLDTPYWAKFLKTSEGSLLWMALLFLGIITLPKNNKHKFNK